MAYDLRTLGIGSYSRLVEFDPRKALADLSSLTGPALHIALQYAQVPRSEEYMPTVTEAIPAPAKAASGENTADKPAEPILTKDGATSQQLTHEQGLRDARRLYTPQGLITRSSLSANALRAIMAERDALEERVTQPITPINLPDREVALVRRTATRQFIAYMLAMVAVVSLAAAFVCCMYLFFIPMVDTEAMSFGGFVTKMPHSVVLMAAAILLMAARDEWAETIGYYGEPLPSRRSDEEKNKPVDPGDIILCCTIVSCALWQVAGLALAFHQIF